MWGSGQQGASDYDGRDVISGLSVGGMGWRTLIVGPHAAAIIDDEDDCHHGGGALCPPLSGLSCPAEYPLSTLLMSPTLVDGGGTRAFGA